MRRVFKFILYVFVLAVGYVVLLINYGENETRITCAGDWKKDGIVTRVETVHVSIFQYAWFNFIASSDGYAMSEIWGGYSRYIDEIEVLGATGVITFDTVGGMERGRYSTLSRVLFLVENGEVFKGQC